MFLICKDKIPLSQLIQLSQTKMSQAKSQVDQAGWTVSTKLIQVEYNLVQSNPWSENYDPHNAKASWDSQQSVHLSKA